MLVLGMKFLVMKTGLALSRVQSSQGRVRRSIPLQYPRISMHGESGGGVVCTQNYCHGGAILNMLPTAWMQLLL